MSKKPGNFLHLHRRSNPPHAATSQENGSEVVTPVGNGGEKNDLDPPRLSKDSSRSQTENSESKEQRKKRDTNDLSNIEDQGVKGDDNVRKSKISLSKMFKFRMTSTPSSRSRRVEPRVMFPGKTVDSENLDNDNHIVDIGTDNLDQTHEEKMLDFGLYKPRNEEDNDDDGRGTSAPRKMSHENVTFHLGSDSESEAEYPTSNGISNGDFKIENEEEQPKKYLEDESNLVGGRQNRDGETVTTRNKATEGGISRGSFTSRSSITLSTPANKERQLCDDSSVSNRKSENNNISIISTDGSSQSNEKSLTRETSNGDFNTDILNNDSNNNNSINSNSSTRSMQNIVQGILRKSSEREQIASMSGGLRRYRRRSQMSITSEIPTDVPQKQRRAECENRIRDNLDYFRRRVSVQEENNVVFDENGVKPVVRKCFSIDDDGSRSGNSITTGYITSPQFHGFKHSSSLGSISPMSLSPTSSAIFDYGTSSNGRRSVNGSISSVRWEDIVLAENNSNNSCTNGHQTSHDIEREKILQQCGHRNAGFSENGEGFINDGFQKKDNEINEVTEGINYKTRNKRRHGSVTLPLNVEDLAHLEIESVPISKQNGSNDRPYNKDNASAGTRGNVRGDDGNSDDPPPYVPMKRRQVDGVVKTDWTKFRVSGTEGSLPDDFRRHSSASVDSVWSTGSVGSSASILRQESLAIFNRKPSSPIRRLSQISMPDFGNIRKKHMEMTKKEWVQTYSLHIFVILIFIVTVLLVSLAWYYRNLSIKMLQQNQRVFFDPRTRKLSLKDPTDHLTIEGYLGLDMPRWQLPLHCPLVVGQDPSMRSCEWKNNAVLTIDHFGNERVQCYNVTWQSMHPWHVPYDCFHLEGSEWYGPSNNSKRVWPISGTFSYSPSNLRLDNNGVFSSAVDLYWISSSGVGLRVHGDDPVFVNWNQTGQSSLCILSNYTGSLYDQHSPPMLKYTICNGMNAVQTHAYMQETFPPKYDTQFPPDYVFSGFYWSVKGIMGRSNNVTQDDINNLTLQASQFSSRLPSHPNPYSRSWGSFFDDVKISLDTYWQRNEGDLTFDTELFPNVTDMLYDMEKTGGQVILSVSPLVFFTSNSFQQGIASDLFVHDAGGTVAGLVEYEKGVASVLDVTKKDVSRWLTEKLQALVASDVISSLRLSYGTFPWLPFKPHFGDPSASPDTQRQRLVEIISELSEAPVIDHTGKTRYLTQLLPVTSRIRYDASSGRKCIHGVIETALTLGLVGYPFVMADGLDDDTLSDDAQGVPDRELYIRWLQIASFFPAAQITTAPWQYDSEVVAIATNYSAIHNTRVLPILQMPSLRKEVANGVPLLRPVWWADPGKQNLQKFEIDDEFVIGDNLLVAPILCKGVRKRDIFIPSGVWEDMRLSKVIIGPNLLENYTVPLHDIAIFKKRETVM